MIDQQKIEECLNPGRPGSVVCLETVPSTNLIAMKLAGEGAANGTVVIAESQTEGAGRLGRSFYSPAGAGIYMSYIFVINPEIPAAGIGLLTSLAGLAVCAAISEIGDIDPQIKWPNDILIDGKKVCGILTKPVTDSTANKITHAVIGIGVNVNQREKSFPKELAGKAGSLKTACGRKIDRERLTAGIINQVDKLLIYENALGKDSTPYIERLRALSCTIGKKVTVSSPGGKETVYALDIAPNGGLIAESPSGKKIIRSGEISG